MRIEKNAETQPLPSPQIERATIEFEEEIREEERIEKVVEEFDKELQIEEDAELVTRINAQAEAEGMKKKKKIRTRHVSPTRTKPIVKDAKVEKDESTYKEKKKKRNEKIRLESYPSNFLRNAREKKS